MIKMNRHAVSLHHAKRMVRNTRRKRSNINHARRRVLMNMESLEQFNELLGGPTNEFNVSMFLMNKPYPSGKHKSKKSKKSRSIARSRK